MFNIFLIVCVALFLFYSIVILAYRRWFLQLKEESIPAGIIPTTSFSIIIPARNEEVLIGNCLLSILQGNYPSSLFEIIVIDDHSTDNTAEIVQQLSTQYYNVQVISLSDAIAKTGVLNAYKKKSIEVGIAAARHEWIITTDADCFAPEKWLQQFDAYIQKNNKVLVAAPVVFTKQNTVLSMFQYIDFVGLQGITAASVSAGFHAMCNGANLAYKKSVFTEVNGFKGIDNIASGDDMLLMTKIKKKYPQQIGFLFSKNAIVATQPMPTWSMFLNQRIRWASKADKLNDRSVLWVLVLVYFFNLLLFIMPLLSILDIRFIAYWLCSLLLKTIVELCFAIPVGRFFGQSFIWWFPVLQPLHIAYTVLAGFLGKFGSYKWKGRKVK